MAFAFRTSTCVWGGPGSQRWHAARVGRSWWWMGQGTWHRSGAAAMAGQPQQGTASGTSARGAVEERKREHGLWPRDPPSPAAAAAARTGAGGGESGPGSIGRGAFCLVMHSKHAVGLESFALGWRRDGGRVQDPGERGARKSICRRASSSNRQGRAGCRACGSVVGSGSGSGASVLVRRRGLSVTSRLGACKQGRAGGGGWALECKGGPGDGRGREQAAGGGPAAAAAERRAPSVGAWPRRPGFGRSCPADAWEAVQAHTQDQGIARDARRTRVQAHVVVPFDGFRRGGLVEGRPSASRNRGADLRLCSRACVV